MNTGTYTIVGPSGGHRTLKIEPHWVDSEAAKGMLVAKYLSGPDNSTDFTGFAFLIPDATGRLNIGVWRRYQNNTTGICEALLFLVTNEDRLGEFGLAYAIRSGRCYMCGRKLTVPVSVCNGLGPICAEKAGIDRVQPNFASVAEGARTYNEIFNVATD